MQMAVLYHNARPTSIDHKAIFHCMQRIPKKARNKPYLIDLLVKFVKFYDCIICFENIGIFLLRKRLIDKASTIKIQ